MAAGDHPDGERDALQAEREFLLASLDDLERERAEGGIDESTYESLHSDYTARAAEVLRTLRAGRDERTKRAPITKSRRAVFVVAAVVFASLGGFALTKAAGEREPGQTITGNPAPDSYQGHLDAARRFEDEGNFNRAAKEFLAASKKDTGKAEPLAELGWLLVQSGDPKLANVAQGYLDAALRRDSGYADAYLYKGVLLYTLEHDDKAAEVTLRQYLRVAPKSAVQRRGMAQAIIDQIQHPNATTTTTTP